MKDAYEASRHLDHQCHAAACEKPCKPEHLMCAKHWRMVRFDLQALVYAAYRPGQAVDKKPSARWFEAARDAVRAVAIKEGRRAETPDWDRAIEFANREAS